MRRIYAAALCCARIVAWAERPPSGGQFRDVYARFEWGAAARPPASTDRYAAHSSRPTADDVSPGQVAGLEDAC